MKKDLFKLAQKKYRKLEKQKTAKNKHSNSAILTYCTVLQKSFQNSNNSPKIIDRTVCRIYSSWF